VEVFEFGSPWIGRVRREAARVRLFCLPFPGAGAPEFLPWAALLPPDVELCAVQLPGRADRFDEEPRTELRSLVADIATAMAPYADLPYALFGHSGGALLAFELSRTLAVEPIRLFVSAEPAPELPRSGPALRDLDDAEFLRQFVARGGLAPEVAALPELVDLVLPTLRADVTWCETYEFRPGPPLACPITAFAGLGDPVTSAGEVDQWAAHTAAAFERHLVDGGHLFVRDSVESVVKHVVTALSAGTS
jgi:medium-chain acyl-[acyl-carrier-protein] hydrolase